MTTQTTAAEEDAYHAELANRDDADAIFKGEPTSLPERFIPRTGRADICRQNTAVGLWPATHPAWSE